MPILSETVRVTALETLAFKRSLLSPLAVGRLLHLPLIDVYSGMRDKWIPSVRVNGAFFTHPRQLREWLQSRDGHHDGMPVLVKTRRHFVPRVIVIPPAYQMAA